MRFVQFIDAARLNGKLKLEEKLWLQLQEVYRSPEAMKAWTDPNARTAFSGDGDRHRDCVCSIVHLDSRGNR